MYVYLKHLLIHNQNKVLHADETTLKVINVSGKKSKKEMLYVVIYHINDDLPIYLYEVSVFKIRRLAKRVLKRLQGLFGR